jgi:hypothetical protein
MMRRTTWLAVGAVLGVVGYRRLDRAAKSFTGQLAPVPLGRHAASAPEPGRSAAARSAGLAMRSAAWLTRSVRHSLSGQRRSRVGLAAFVRDVRAGIDEYLGPHEAYIDRQDPRSGNTLVGQRARKPVPVQGGALGRGRTAAVRSDSDTTHETKDGC